MADDDHPLLGQEGTVLGEIKRKLIERKQAWAREGRLLTGEKAADARTRRLPPGQHRTAKWPVLDLGLQPVVVPGDWKLAVVGLVDNPLLWDWAALMAAPQVELTSDVHCVTAWSLYDNRWRGVAARSLLAVVRPKPAARFIVFHSHDGYTTNVPLARFAADDVLLAHTWNDRPLAREHGGPVRVVIPKLYFWKSAKWVRQLTFLGEDVPGYWEVRGYHNEGDPWKEERYG